MEGNATGNAIGNRLFMTSVPAMRFFALHQFWVDGLQFSIQSREH